MSNDNTIAPAFPVQSVINANGETQWGSDGVNKREYFALKALQGLLANSQGPIQANGMNGWGLVNCTWEQVAGAATRAGDALLAELNK